MDLARYQPVRAHAYAASTNTASASAGRTHSGTVGTAHISVHQGSLYGPFSTWFDSKILYILHEMQYLAGGQRLYPNSATAVDQICRFQDKIRIEVDKIDKIAS